MSSDTLTRAGPIVAKARRIFSGKMEDYGPSWRVLRPGSVLDQIRIKVERIRTLQEKGEQKVEEGIVPELYGILNYSVIALIQMKDGVSDQPDVSIEKALERYDAFSRQALDLMERKNHDYGEAWKDMKVPSIVDLMLVKLIRIEKMGSDPKGTKTSEGADANYFDIINYAIFALLKLGEDS
jgi:hypothetical protein